MPNAVHNPLRQLVKRPAFPDSPSVPWRSGVGIFGVTAHAAPRRARRSDGGAAV
jgi:hypothetical protein